MTPALPSFRRRLSVVALAIASTTAPQTLLAKVTVDEANKVFRLDGADVTYAIGVDEKGYLQPLYWGSSLGKGEPLLARASKELSGFDPAGMQTAQEFAGQGEGLVTDPGLKVTFSDGSRDLVLKYRSYRMDGQSLVVELADIERPLTVNLRYAIDEQTGVITRSATVTNRGRAPIKIESFAAANLTLPGATTYQLHFLSGRHAAEWSPHAVVLSPALTVLESRRGSVGHGNQPWLAISRPGQTTEESGPVWFGALAWSGSFRLSAQTDNIGRVRIAGGYNSHDFAWTLRPGESLDSPRFYAGYSSSGLGGASRAFHRFQMDQVIPGGRQAKLRPVLYNSWEATAFDVTAEGQMKLAERAAKLGVERFVVDDGWFGQRNDDKAGLGDWTVNPAKFPQGLKPLIDRVHALGMSFGLWFEPEMVNRDSALYRAHPDWVLNFPGRPRTEGRNQLVLNLARTDVRDHLLSVLDKLLRENDIQFIKWDYNRNWTEPGWPEAGPDQQRVYVDYISNLYHILAELRKRHPGLEIETCSGGGGRIDTGIMGLTDQAWTSDNTDPYDRLAIQDGFTMAYAPAVMMAWVTDVPNWANGRTTSLDFRFLSAMQGGLGIGADLNKWTSADDETARNWIEAYKGIRETVQRGQLYRLVRPTDGASQTATFYVSPDRSQGVLFAMQRSSEWRDQWEATKLAGLDPARRYRARRLGGGQLPDGVPSAASGAYWMSHGVTLRLRGDYVGLGMVLEAAGADQSGNLRH
ncbi:alpha-galactosidase [Novosphingobium flavum]|uniref:alpha-galactosidase n=1 Tax=Novosphingobium aerophilum TaxID=2839843 RepID=UPI00163B132B|nr:alpha-galactosidase [Novosphingobium aerophilum]MBC2662338.1 alpha-galactosidase [Novosphingobium aerophilum]